MPSESEIKDNKPPSASTRQEADLPRQGSSSDKTKTKSKEHASQLKGDGKESDIESAVGMSDLVNACQPQTRLTCIEGDTSSTCSSKHQPDHYRFTDGRNATAGGTELAGLGSQFGVAENHAQEGEKVVLAV